MQHCLLDVLRGQTIKLIHSVSNVEFHEAYFFCAEGPCLVRLLSLVKSPNSQIMHLPNITHFFAIYFITVIFGLLLANESLK